MDQPPKKTDDSNKSVWVIIRILIIILALPILGIILAMVLVIMNGHKNKNTASTSTPTTATSNSSTTANWATYSDTTNGFSFKYPNSWQKQAQSATIVDLFPQPPGDAQRLEVIVYNDSIATEKAKIDQQDQNINIYHNFTVTTVAGKSGYISRVITIDNHNYQTVLIDMGNGKTIYIDAEGDPVQQVDTILSTFIFSK